MRVISHKTTLCPYSFRVAEAYRAAGIGARNHKNHRKMKRVTLVAVNDGKTFPNVSCAVIYLQAQIEASIKGICRKLSRMDDPGAISEYLRQNKKILASMLEIESEIDEGLALMSETK